MHKVGSLERLNTNKSNHVHSIFICSTSTYVISPVRHTAHSSSCILTDTTTFRDICSGKDFDQGNVTRGTCSQNRYVPVRYNRWHTMVFVHMGECISNMTLSMPRSQSCHICLVHTGAHEPKERRRSAELSMRALVEVVVLHTSQTFTLYGKRPLCKSVKDKLVFVQYSKGLPYKV